MEVGTENTTKETISARESNTQMLQGSQSKANFDSHRASVLMCRDKHQIRYINYTHSFRWWRKNVEHDRKDSEHQGWRGGWFAAAVWSGQAESGSTLKMRNNTNPWSYSIVLESSCSPHDSNSSFTLKFLERNEVFSTQAPTLAFNFEAGCSVQGHLQQSQPSAETRQQVESEATQLILPSLPALSQCLQTQALYVPCILLVAILKFLLS